jgi:1,4-alpha-glucan branching enzyme
MTELARQHFGNQLPTIERLLSQAARELLLAQSSDWAFLMKTGTARAYAVRRTEEHIHRFNRLHEQAVSGVADEAFLANCEARDNIFPNLCWRYYA